MMERRNTSEEVRQFTEGESRDLVIHITRDIVADFIRISGDRNPIHHDANKAREYGFPRPVVHGALLTAFISKLVGEKIPGPGALLVDLASKWVLPVYVGDVVHVAATVRRYSAGTGMLVLDVSAHNDHGDQVMAAQAKVKVMQRVTESASLEKKAFVALVTGSSRGIGAATAEALAASGLTVAVNYLRSKQEAEDTVSRIRAARGRALPYDADVSDPEACSRLIRAVITDFGRVDVVVHSATPPIELVDVEKLNYSTVERFLQTYVCAGLSLVQSALPGMTARSFGRLIFLGSSYMFGPPPLGTSAYVISKHALLGLVRCLATELGPRGITCNMVSPGITITDLTANIPARTKEIEARRNPTRQLATGADTANVIRFLASEASGHVNGQNIPVTGGPI